MEFLSLTSLNEALEKQDIERGLNSSCAVSQTHGAVARSISYATYASMYFAKAEYTAIENDNTEGRFSAKGSGEAPVLLPPVVISSVLVDAIGKPIPKIPITPKDVPEALA